MQEVRTCVGHLAGRINEAHCRKINTVNAEERNDREERERRQRQEEERRVGLRKWLFTLTETVWDLGLMLLALSFKDTHQS